MAKRGGYHGGSTIIHVWGVTAGDGARSKSAPGFRIGSSRRTRAKSAVQKRVDEKRNALAATTGKAGARANYRTFAEYRAAIRKDPKLAEVHGLASPIKAKPHRRVIKKG